MNIFVICNVSFLCFEVVSWLKINLSKSEIIPIGEVDDVEKFGQYSLV